jgi:hypothetical protein
VTIFGIGIIWFGYTVSVYGYSMFMVGRSQNIAPSLSISDLVLPSHLPAYQAAMGAYAAGGTTSLVNPSTEQPQALAQAQKDMAAACAGTGANSTACKNAKQRVANIQSVIPTTGASTTPAPSGTTTLTGGATIKNNWAGSIIKFAKGL